MIGSSKIVGHGKSRCQCLEETVIWNLLKEHFRYFYPLLLFALRKKID